MKRMWVCVGFIKVYIKKLKSGWIPDKQAMLLLVLHFLLTLSILSYSDYAGYCLDSSFYKVEREMFYSEMGGVFIFLLSGLFSAWLVGWKYRLVDIVFNGMIITGIAFLVGAVPNMIISGTNKCSRQDTVIIMIIFYVIVKLGTAPVYTNFFQLAIEQLPDASSSQLSSLTSWYIFSGICGYWCYVVGNGILWCYLSLNSESALKYLSYFTLVHGIIIAFVLSSFALIKHKLVDNSPTSNTVTHLYQVVKYAIKHRRPVQRSAMTYWEDKIPTGMDLGKRKYGGPFTSEQVEDVKTFFWLSLLFVIAYIYLFSIHISVFTLLFVDEKVAAINDSFEFVGIFDCGKFVMSKVVGSYYLWILIFIVVYEVIIKPLLCYKIPDARKRLKFGIVLSFLVFSVTSIVVTINRCLTLTYVIKSFWLEIGLWVPMGIAIAIVYVAGLEFLIAQTPYAMRNFFISVGYSVGSLVVSFSSYAYTIFDSQCKSRNCPIIYSLVSLSFNFVAMLLFWIAITRYRMRSRGQEDEHQQRWIEEVYDRYLEQVDT